MNNYRNNNWNDPIDNAGISRARQSYPSYSSARTDFGPNPFLVDLNKATLHNNYYRSALWTGNLLQLTLMSIPVGGDIGIEMHPNDKGRSG